MRHLLSCLLCLTFTVLPNAGATAATTSCLSNYGATPETVRDLWREAFMRENFLTPGEFDSHVSVTSVREKRLGARCAVKVKYNVTHDWLSVSRTDELMLSRNTDALTVTSLELERTSNGRRGVSHMLLKEPLLFSDEKSAIDRFLKNQGAASLQVQSVHHGFQYHWDVRDPNAKGVAHTGVGGEPFLGITAALDDAGERCIRGQIALTGGTMAVVEEPCRRY